MPSSIRTYATLVIAMQSASNNGDQPETIQGFALLVVQRCNADTWSFSLNSAVARTIADEAEVLRQLADVLPRADFLIGDNIERQVVAPLERAADRLATTAAAYLRCRLARLQAALSVDLSVGRVRPQPPSPFAKPLPISPPLTLAIEDGAIFDVNRSSALIEARVVDDWLRFLTVSRNPTISTATVATITWLTSRGWCQ